MGSEQKSMDYDVLVVGGGIAGMETALTLGDMGFRVLVVEKEASIGGKMILLSKVFPTLDCASCISTPKMAATINHPQITVFTYSEVEKILKDGNGGFQVNVRRKPTFVDAAKCTGCAECEPVCTVAIPDEFNADLVARRAAHIAFPQAVPKKAVIDRIGTSPCTFRCPAGVHAHGYVSLVRSGKFQEAFNLHMEDAPLPGCLSRACYAPCEDECTRGMLEGSVSIRAIKRFMVDEYYKEHPGPEYGPPEELNGKKVAIVGSGPAGLSASYFLARKGYTVVILEANSEAGGAMRWAIPQYRLPNWILDRDLLNITALGVEIKTNSPVSSINKLLEDGYDAVFLAVGNTGGRRLSVPGEDLEGVKDAIDFLARCKSGTAPRLDGKRVVVVGGGNVAIDCARSSLRLGADVVELACLESREEMPSHEWEIQQAIEEGVRINCSWGVKEILGKGGKIEAIELKRCTSVFDENGRFAPRYDEKKTTRIEADFIILAIGLRPNTSAFSGQIDIKPNGTINVDERTLMTSMPGVFAGGDAVIGPSMIVDAIGQGKRAAYYIDCYLKGEDLKQCEFETRIPVVDKDSIVEEVRGRVSPCNRVEMELKPCTERIKSFEEYEKTLSEVDARSNANRCLDCGRCSECRQCVSACPADAIVFDMKPQEIELKVGAVVLATGFDLFDPGRKPALRYNRIPNVITAMQMERLLAPTRPYNAVLRPSDGKSPSNIAFVLCTGSRDHKVDNRLCSRVCCMYSLKQAQLLMGALPLADITIYYIDIRAFGKGYDEFFEQARQMGVYFVKGKVARIEETKDQNLIVHYEDIEGEGGMKQAEHDLVVLSIGLLPTAATQGLFEGCRLQTDAFSYVKEVSEELEPSKTSIEGVFVAGTASGIKDIPDTILHAGAAASQVGAYLVRKGKH